jgi:hypothetical protein
MPRPLLSIRTGPMKDVRSPVRRSAELGKMEMKMMRLVYYIWLVGTNPA